MFEKAKKALKERFYNSKPGKKILKWAAIYRSGKVKSRIGFVDKNKKMKPTENVGFLIFSIPCVFTCPHATVECLKHCYAKSAYMYDSVCKNHVGNFIETLKTDFVENAIKAIHETIYTKKGTVRKKYQKKDGTIKDIYVRVHESGDFYSKEYMLKWFEIAKHYPDLHFFSYTKCIKMYKELKEYKPNNYTVRCSLFPDTPIEEVEWIMETKQPFYTAVNEFSKENDYKCDCTLGCGYCGCICSREDMITVETILKK